MSKRTEKDLIGSVEIDNSCYYGVQTLRGMHNFNITKVSINDYPIFIEEIARLKEIIANANHQIGMLSTDKFKAISHACKEIVNGEYHDQFDLDVIQGGAGTSTNMAANEIIANIALESMGHKKGEYQFLSPNDDINMSQSTNDFYPSACKLAILKQSNILIESLKDLSKTMQSKALEYKGKIKLSRTQMQDAVPSTFDQYFNSYDTQIQGAIESINAAKAIITKLNIGATAVGTGINSHINFVPTAEKILKRYNPNLSIAKDLHAATQDATAFMPMSDAIKFTATKLSKIANDIIILSSGPNSGIGEINIPAVQPGSSIMPGKINPVIAEVMRLACFQVIGSAQTIDLCAHNGQLELNAFESVIMFNVMESICILSNAINTFNEKCVSGITINEDKCLDNVNRSASLVTSLVHKIGYSKSSEIAVYANTNKVTVLEAAKKLTEISENELKDLLDPAKLTTPNIK